MKKLIRDLCQTNGKWSGAKVSAWGAVGTILSTAIDWTFIQHHELSYMAVGSAVLAVGAVFVGAHYGEKKADSQYPGPST